MKNTPRANVAKSASGKLGYWRRARRHLSCNQFHVFGRSRPIPHKVGLSITASVSLGVGASASGSSVTDVFVNSTLVVPHVNKPSWPRGNAVLRTCAKTGTEFTSNNTL